MKKVLLSFLVVISALLVLTGCTGKKVDPIVGSWTYGSSYTYEFKEDGTGSYAGRNFTYKVDGDKLSITYDGTTSPFETTFKIEGKTLIIKDSFGEDVKYEKK